jgi:hypothetical protein
MELATLPWDARETGLPGRLETGVIITDNTLNPVQATGLEAPHEVTPMHLRLGQTNAGAKDGAFPLRIDPHGDQDRTGDNGTTMTDLLVTGIDNQILHIPPWSLPPGSKLNIELLGGL